MIRFGLFVVALVPMSCDSLNKNLLDCSDACAQVQSCSATPPDPVFGSLGAVSSGQGGVDCAAGCASADAPLHGYAPCQVDCLTNSECGEIQDCWKPNSDLYASYCLVNVDVPDVGSAQSGPAPTNGSESGNGDADDVLDDPAVAIAVDESSDDGFVVNYGEDPPELIGKYDVHGKIDESSNARPVGSPIDTSICFWDYGTNLNGDGIEVSYCEDGVPGEPRAPLTGSKDAFTVYFVYPGQATVLFSGSIHDDGTLDNVEALVVYTYGTEIYELSHTDWVPQGECHSCSQ